MKEEEEEVKRWKEWKREGEMEEEERVEEEVEVEEEEEEEGVEERKGEHIAASLPEGSVQSYRRSGQGQHHHIHGAAASLAHSAAATWLSHKTTTIEANKAFITSSSTEGIT